MSPYKTACVVSLGTLAVLITAIAVASEVRAGGSFEDVPVAATVDQDTIAQASAFAGDYTFIGGQKERDGLAAAIETSMDAVSPLVRGIGRKRLQESNPIYKQISIKVDGDAVELVYDGRGHKATLDGTPIRTANQGDKVKISHRMHGSKLTQFIDGGEGDRRNTFKLNNDGSRLTLNVEILSGHLPVPVEYRLTFKRK